MVINFIVNNFPISQNSPRRKRVRQPKACVKEFVVNRYLNFQKKKAGSDLRVYANQLLFPEKLLIKLCVTALTVIDFC